jgi:hypothetical protein
MSAGNTENAIALLVVALVALIVGIASTLFSEYLSNEAGVFFIANAKRLKLRRQALGKVREKHAKYLAEAREELGLKAVPAVGGPIQPSPPFKSPPPPTVVNVEYLDGWRNTADLKGHYDAIEARLKAGLKWNPPHLEEDGPSGVVDLDALKKL